MKPKLTLLALALLATGCGQNAETTPAETQARPQESATTASTQSAQTNTTSLIPPEGWREGIHYEPIAPSRPTSTGPGKIEVIEFMGYWCPHCRDLEPVLEYWRYRTPDDVVLVRVPVTWGREPLRPYARMFYTLERLDRANLHRPFFDAVNAAKRDEKKSKLDTFEDQKAFAVGRAIDPQAFETMYRSDGVSKDVENAERMAGEYQIHATPSIVVQGKYRTTSGKAGGLSQAMILADELIARERKH